MNRPAVVCPILLLVLLPGCASGPPITPLSPTAIPTQPSPAAILTPAMAPTASPDLATATPTPASEGPMPGWVWYETEDFTLAVPKVWRIAENEYGGGELRFISPETYTQVLIYRSSLTHAGDWLEYVHRPEYLSVLTRSDLAPEVVTANATLQGQPAFFHFEPAHSGGGETAVLLVPYSGTLYRVFYYGSPVPPLDAEAIIFATMLESLRFTGQDEQPTDLPDGWWQGDALTFYLGADLAASADDSVVDLQGVVAERYDPPTGRFAVGLADGQRIPVMMPPVASFSAETGMGFGYVTAPGAMSIANLEAGSEVRVVGVMLESGDLLPYLVLLPDGAGGWQMGGYRAFFDVSRGDLNAPILDAYPSGEVRLWLYGLASDVIPLFWADHDFSMEGRGLTEETLVLAQVIRRRGESLFQLETLYLQWGDCRSVPHRNEAGESYSIRQCFTFLPHIATNQPETLGGKVRSFATEERVIVLREPVSGYITVTLGEGVRVFGHDGERVDEAAWPDHFLSGVELAVEGSPGEAGTFIANRVQLGPPPATDSH